MPDRPLYAVYHKHCGHVINVHANRAIWDPIADSLQRATGFALRTRKATDADLEALIRGDRCDLCTVDGKTTLAVPDQPHEAVTE
jgi:hypothetical protein